VGLSNSSFLVVWFADEWLRAIRTCDQLSDMFVHMGFYPGVCAGAYLFVVMCVLLNVVWDHTCMPVCAHVFVVALYVPPHIFQNL